MLASARLFSFAIREHKVLTKRKKKKKGKLNETNERNEIQWPKFYRYLLPRYVRNIKYEQDIKPTR